MSASVQASTGQVEESIVVRSRLKRSVAIRNITKVRASSVRHAQARP